MLCSCGKQGDISIERREMPYCQACFEAMLVRCVRQELGEDKDNPVLLTELGTDTPPEEKTTQKAPQSANDYYLQAAVALCALARREARVVAGPEGFVPGCAETAAAATVRYLLGQSTTYQKHFPSSITREELQRFMRAQPPVLDTLAQELVTFDKAYPGTIRSITKWKAEPSQ